jgi:hypothetical protein
MKATKLLRAVLIALLVFTTLPGAPLASLGGCILALSRRINTCFASIIAAD